MKPKFTIVNVEMQHESEDWLVLNWCTESAESEDWLVLNWCTESAGFGQLSFKAREDGLFDCHNEAMSYQFCYRVVRDYCKGCEEKDLPKFVRVFGSAEEFMLHTVPYGGSW